MLIQVLAPITYAASSFDTEMVIETEVDLELLNAIGLAPSGEMAHGWFNPADGVGEINLLFRDMGVIAVEDWSEWTSQSSKLTGWYVLTHEYPIPTEWFNELNDAGIDCFTYMPPNGFQCELNGHTTTELEELEVEGLVQLDAVDKLREDLVRGVLGQEKLFTNPYSIEGKAIVSIVLSSTELPDGIGQRDDIVIDSHSGRFVTAVADTSGIAWLASNEAIEWIETKPYFTLNNDVAATIIHADDLQNSATMSGLNSGWGSLDGSGIIVTVGDTGLDNGVNNSGMHPDFADHIKGILSFPVPASGCAWTGGNPGSCDDGAIDDHGHGTHVAGSVLGDGTTWTNVKGMAPEAQLLVHALEYNGGLGGIPNDLGDMFDLAVANGSRVHTNSWGSNVAGAYTTSSMQSDMSTLEHDNLVIMYAAANEGTDADGDGKIDEDSLGSPATAKNVISIGASENLRSNASGTYLSDNIEGMAVFSSRGPTDDGRTKPDFSAPGTNILSTKSRSSGGSGDYTYMSGTSMATPVSAGATALLLQHLIDNLNESNPSSALIKGIFAATSVDMAGQYGDATDGAGQTAPNNHEGWGRIQLLNATSASFVDRESLSTGEERGWSINVPSAAPTMQIMLSYNDATSSPVVSANLVNDVDLSIKDPSGTWTNLSDNINNLKGLTFASPAQGVWEIHVVGTSVAPGVPQFFSVAVNSGYLMVNLTQDADFDGIVDENDQCAFTFGTSVHDRQGCPDTDGDGYSDPASNWSIAQGADVFIADKTQWADQDGDGYGDNSIGTNPDGCPSIAGTSTGDRNGCIDTDMDTFSDAESNLGGWTIAQGADACINVAGTSTGDRNGCPDEDGDTYSDPDPSGTNGSVWLVSNGADAFLGDNSQWNDTDSDGFGDNPPPATLGDACPTITGTSLADRIGCTDTDGDGYSDADLIWLAHPTGTADAFPNDITQWLDTDGDGYGDNQSGNNPDACPTFFANSSVDRIGCPDTDGDGYSDPEPNWTPAGNGSDAFKTDPTQWTDADGDGFGDNATGNLADDCPTIPGESWQNNTLGCVDTDQDGWADQEDAQVNDSTQWSDIDGDGYGDNSGGTTPDACVSLAGNSTLGNRMGCPDTDGDGWDDVIDLLPNLANQWLDQDGDGYGDNATGPQPDACPGIAGNSTIDRYGCVDDDGDGMSNDSDAFPNDPIRTQDTDGDGFDDLEDDCINSAGNSTVDRKACPDTDGDGYSDPTLPDGNISGWNSTNGADALPFNPTQWNDSDGDGYGENALGTEPDACPTVEGYSNLDVFGCPDEDNDGSSQSGDLFPDDATQWSDIDGDGFGDNPNGTQPDNCTMVIGTSYLDVYGCLDSDNDGASDTNDLWNNDSSQWFDTDGDGWGDNSQGTDGDVCPNTFGTASLGTAPGCIDTDGDGYANSNDAFPNEPTQWVDGDGDGYGDNQSSGASRPDHWVNDPTRNIAEGAIICTPTDIQLNLAEEDYFSFSCTVVSELNDITVRVEWQQISSIIASEQIQVLSFTETTGLTQTIFFSGEGRTAGNFDLYIVIKEPGVDIAMDSASINLRVYDTRIADESDSTNDEASALNKIIEMPIIQALLGGIVLFFLMGMLVIRGNASKSRIAEERVERAREVITARMNRINEPPADSLRQAFRVNGRVPPPPPPRPPMP